MDAGEARDATGIVFIVDTSATMCNGDYEPTRWGAQKAIVHCICSAYLCGSRERGTEPLFGLVHSSSGRNKTRVAVPPCKGSQLDLMQRLEELSHSQEDESIDLATSLKLLQLSLRQSECRPRVVVISSHCQERADAPTCLDASLQEKVRRLDYVCLKGCSTGEEADATGGVHSALERLCSEHGGNFVPVAPFSTSVDTFRWQEAVLSGLDISQRFADKAQEGKHRGKPVAEATAFAGSGSDSPKRRFRMSESCRGESLDSYQHLSFDGFAHSWLPSYSSALRKHRELGGGLVMAQSQQYLLVIKALCDVKKWQTVFTIKAGRMLSKQGKGKGARLEPLAKKGTLKLMCSQSRNHWCFRWCQADVGTPRGGAVEGLLPLVAKKPERKICRDDGISWKCRTDEVALSRVPCDTGEVLCAQFDLHRRPAYFWLQEPYEYEQLKGAEAVAAAMKNTMKNDDSDSRKNAFDSNGGIVSLQDSESGGDAAESLEDHNPIAIVSGAIESLSDENALVGVHVMDMDDAAFDGCGTDSYDAQIDTYGDPLSFGALVNFDSDDDCAASKKVETLERGFLQSWTATLETQINEESQKLSQNHGIVEPANAKPSNHRGTKEKGTEESLLFELD